MRRVESEIALIKLKRIVIRQVDQGARGAIYGVLNRVEINLKKFVTIRGNYVSNRRRRDRFGATKWNASSRIWNCVNKKLKRIVIREVDQGARGAIYGLLNHVEIH